MSLLRRLYEKVTPAFLRPRLGFAHRFLTRPLVRRQWRTARRAKRRNLEAERLVRQGHVTVTTHVPQGQLIVDLRDECVGRVIYATNQYEEAETAYLNRTLRPGMVVYDIGANLGYMTSLAASLVAVEGLVLSFEPDPYNFELLTKNVELNGFKNVRLFNVALGNECGVTKLYKSESNFGDHRLYSEGSDSRGAVEVKVRNLDELRRSEGLPIPDFIKVDVQGFEAFVFAGMKETLKSCPSLRVLTEYWPSGIRNAGEDPKSLLAFFRDNGFDVATLTIEGDAVPRDWSAIHSILEEANVYDSEGYVNLVMIRRPGSWTNCVTKETTQ